MSPAKDDPVEEIKQLQKKETPPDFDPLLAQAERLPDSIKGSDGDKAHVLPVGSDGEAVDPAQTMDDEDAFDPKPGEDASSLTADS